MCARLWSHWMERETAMTELDTLKRRAVRCVTHYYGCDCREYRQALLEDVAVAARAYQTRWIDGHAETETEMVIWHEETDQLFDVLAEALAVAAPRPVHWRLPWRCGARTVRCHRRLQLVHRIVCVCGQFLDSMLSRRQACVHWPPASSGSRNPMWVSTAHC